MWHRHSHGPFFSWDILNDRGRLRVVDDGDVVIQLEFRGVVLVDLQIVKALFLGQGKRLVALKRVVHLFGDVEELVRGFHHLPMRLDARVPEKRHEILQNLRHTPAKRRRVVVAQRGSAQRVRLLFQRVHLFVAQH